jgi:hypothetical protein
MADGEPGSSANEELMCVLQRIKYFERQERLVIVTVQWVFYKTNFTNFLGLTERERRSWE